MIETFTFTVTDNTEILIKKDINCNVIIHGGNSIYVGPENVTIADGFPLTPGYNNFKLKAGDYLYVVTSNQPKTIRVIITEDP